MARIRYTHNSFSIGVLSERILGNTEFEGYNNALRECVNFNVQQTGGVFKRGGTVFVQQTKEEYARLILFSYSAGQEYICEFGYHYIRFFTKEGPLLDINGNIVEVATTFDKDTVKSIKTFQDGNVLNLVTETGIYSLVRKSLAEFAISGPIKYTADPLTFMNREKIALKPDTKSGTINIVAVNPDTPSEKPAAKFAPVFFASDKGSILVLTYSIVNPASGYIGDKAFYLDIKSVTTDTAGFNKISATINKTLTGGEVTELPNLNPVSLWQISAFTKDRGMPKAVAMYESRLFLANNSSYPTGIWGSSRLYNDWTDFYPGSNAADAVQHKMKAIHADGILWLASQAKLFAGTKWGIYICGSATYNDEAITPDNFRLRLFTSIGASELQPIVALDSIFFVDSSGRNVHEIRLSAETGTYDASDISLLSNDLTSSGIVAHAWQETPIKTYWCAVRDGFLCSLTYLKNNNILAWSKHVIAGKSVKVEDLCVMHGDKSDRLWMIVRREINGKFVRYIEYMKPAYDPQTQEEFKQYYVDCGIEKEDKRKILNIDRGKQCAISIFTGKNFDRYTKLLAQIPIKERLLYLTGADILATFSEYQGIKESVGHLPNAGWWQSICYGDGKFVAVAFGTDEAAYSADGINWTAATLPTTNDWKSVCYGNGKFVAVANNIKAVSAYSTDGINWTAATLPSSAYWQSVCYGNGKFVAVAFGTDEAAYSADGINWTAATLPTTNDWKSVCYGNGKFVAVAINSNKAAYSTNGINWTETTMPSVADWYSVCYGNGKFVAVYRDFNKTAEAAYSTDGINWTETTMPSNEPWQSVCYGNGKFVAVAYDSYKAAYSANGINWTETTMPLLFASWYSVCYGNGKFVAVAQNDIAANVFGGEFAVPVIGYLPLSKGEYVPYKIDQELSYLPGDSYAYIKVGLCTKNDDHKRIYCNTENIFVGDSIKVLTHYYTVTGKTSEYLKVSERLLYNLAGAQIFLKLGSFEVHTSSKRCVITLSDDAPQKSGSIYLNKINGTTELNSRKFKYIRHDNDHKKIDLLLDPEEEGIPVKNKNFYVEASHYSPFDTVDVEGNTYFYFDIIDGIDHLAGQKIAICCDGNTTEKEFLLSSDQKNITLPRPAMHCVAGLLIKSWLLTTPFSGGSLLGSSVGCVGGQKSMWLHLYYSLGGKYGAEPSKVYDIPYTNFISMFNKTKSLISGLVKCPIGNAHDIYDRSIYIEHEEPVAFNILSLTQDIEVSDS